MKTAMRPLIALAGLCLLGNAAQAALVQTFGTGSAVTTVTATADFESQAALGATYSEGGMTFSRVGLSTNNNGCGYAGCSGNFAPYGFVGNYFYGANTSGGTTPKYIQIDAAAGSDFQAIEFLFGWGPLSAQYFYWEAYDNGSLVGSGSGSAAPGTVFGLSGGAFDSLHFTTSYLGRPINSLSQGDSPAIDNVRVGLSGGTVPEPGTIALVLLGALAASTARRKAGSGG